MIFFVRKNMSSLKGFWFVNVLIFYKYLIPKGIKIVVEKQASLEAKYL